MKEIIVSSKFTSKYPFFCVNNLKFDHSKEKFPFLEIWKLTGTKIIVQLFLFQSILCDKLGKNIYEAAETRKK